MPAAPVPRLLLVAALLGGVWGGLAWGDESPVGYLEMPADPEGAWVLTHGPGSENHWGRPEFVRYLALVAREWRRRHPEGPVLRIGDMSKPDASAFPPHKSHKDGLTADLFTTPQNVCHVRFADQELTLELAQLCYDLGARQILYNGARVVKEVAVAQRYQGHDDHFHVVVDPSRVPSEGAPLVLPGADWGEDAVVSSAQLQEDNSGLRLSWRVLGQTRITRQRVLLDDGDEANGVLYESNSLRARARQHEVPLALAHGQLYRWNVILETKKERYELGWHTFRADLEDPQVEPFQPGEGEELNASPSLSWRYHKPGAAQASFSIELDRDSNHTRVTKRLGPFPGDAHQFELGKEFSLRKGRRYFWRVVVKDVHGNRGLSQWQSFRTSQEFRDEPQPGKRTPTGRVSASALNLRAGPSAGEPVLRSLPLGTELRILEERGGWLRVSVELKQGPSEGWVSAEYVVLESR